MISRRYLAHNLKVRGSNPPPATVVGAKARALGLGGEGEISEQHNVWCSPGSIFRRPTPCRGAAPTRGAFLGCVAARRGYTAWMTAESATVEPPPWTDERLVQALQAGEAAAFEALVRQHGGYLLGVARRLLQQEEDARDAVQEALLQAYRKIAGFQGNASLRTWLHRIVVNASLMKMRVRARLDEQPLDDLLPQFDQWGCRVEPSWHFDGNVDDLLARKQIREEVRRRIEQLPEGYRVVLMLRDIEGLSTKEAAALLDLGEAAVKVRLHRARAALKKLLEPFWQESGS